MKSVGIPLILTFQLDPLSQERLDAWRARYFPKDRNFLKAHLTIFHQLPGQSFESIEVQLEDFAAEQFPFAITFDQLLTKQGFVGIRASGESLETQRSELSELFAALLRSQDKQPYRPHVTIANLGSPREAASCFKELEKDFTPWAGKVQGLELYHYRGGPWEFAKRFPFAQLGDSR